MLLWPNRLHTHPVNGTPALPYESSKKTSRMDLLDPRLYSANDGNQRGESMSLETREGRE